MWIPTTLNIAKLSNRRVHELADLKKKAFVEKIESTCGFRTCWNEQGLSWYPTSMREWTLWNGLYNAVNNGDYSNIGCNDGRRPFGLILARPLYNFLKRNELAVIEKQIVAFLAGLWVRDDKNGMYIKEQVYSPVFKQVQVALKDVFQQSSYDQLSHHSQIIDRYNSDFELFSGAAPAEFLELLDYTEDYGSKQADREKRWAITSEFGMGFGYYYLNETEWNGIVIKGNRNELSGYEYDALLWDEWFHDYKNCRDADNHELTLFADATNPGLIYIIRQENSNFYKIGWTTDCDPAGRLKALQTGSPAKLSLTGYFAASSRKIEKSLHDIFHVHHQHGEWFVLTENQVASLLDVNWRRTQQIL